MAEKKVMQEILEETTQEVAEVNEVADEVATEETSETPTLLTLDEFKEKLVIKEKTSIAEQQMLVQTVYDSCVKKDEKNGIYYIDYIMLKVAFNFSILQYYTNYYEIVEQIKELNEGVSVYLVGYYCPFFEIEEGGEVFSWLNDSIKEVSEFSGANYVDISEVGKEENMFNKQQIYLNNIGQVQVYGLLKDNYFS